MDVFLQSIEHISLMIKTDHNTTQQFIHFVFFNVLIHFIFVYPASDIHEYPFRLHYVFSHPLFHPPASTAGHLDHFHSLSSCEVLDKDLNAKSVLLSAILVLVTTLSAKLVLSNCMVTLE